MGRWFGVVGSVALTAFLGLAVTAGSGIAQETVHLPHDYQIGLQPAATPVMERIVWFHNSILLPLIVVITLFVLALLVIVMVRFNARANPTPSRTTHHTTIELIWTVVPIVILVAIAIPSFKLLYFQREIPPADMTLKVTGHQWYWTYEYPDQGDFTYDSLIVQDEDLKEGQPRLFTVDNPVVVPAGKVIRVQVTSEDVIHDWAVPAFGVKIDAIPGRLNEAWFEAKEPGVYYGMCSELCGINHAFMPIQVRALPEDEFNKWVEEAKGIYAAAPRPEGDGQERTASIAGARRPAH